MANKHNSLSHTKWLCKYHIVFTPKYRRKIEFNQYKRDIVGIIKRLCKYKGVEIIFVTINTTKIQSFKFYGIFEREKFTDDI